MRSNIPMIVNAVAITVALGCLLAALSCDRQYGQAHSRATQATETANQSGTDFDPKRGGLTSPEIYYQRAKSVRQWGGSYLDRRAWCRMGHSQVGTGSY